MILAILVGFLGGMLVTVGGMLVLLFRVLQSRVAVARAASGAVEEADAKAAAAADAREATTSAMITPGADVADASWPTAAVEQIRAALAEYGEAESCQWLNILAMRHFLELRSSIIFKERLMRKLTAKLRPKIAGSNFIVRGFA